MTSESAPLHDVTIQDLLEAVPAAEAMEVEACDLRIVKKSEPESDTELDLEIKPKTEIDVVEEEFFYKTSDESQRIVELERQLRDKTTKCNTLETEITKLQARVTQLEDSLSTINQNLGKIFTPLQLKLIENPNTKDCKWTDDDIVRAISFRRISAKAYTFVKDKLNVPLPMEHTLQIWASNLPLKPGILSDIMPIMSNAGKYWSDLDRLTVLSFHSVNFPDTKPKSCQIALARGLSRKWMQPVFYEFAHRVTKPVLLAIISQLYDSGYTVVAIVTDINTSLWSSLNIGSEVGENCYFLHPNNEKVKVFTFVDVPQLLKLARNYMLTEGFHFDDVFVDIGCLKELVLNSKGLEAKLNITPYHLTRNGFEREEVRYAAQIFSNTNARMIQWCGEHGRMDELPWHEAAWVLKLFNDWFDIFNSSDIDKHPYGDDIGGQNFVLNAMTIFCNKLRVAKRESLLPFQTAIIVNNNALQYLLPFLRHQAYGKRKIRHLFTERLNKEPLESLCTYLKDMALGIKELSANEFRQRLRYYILGQRFRFLIELKINNIEPLMTQCLEAYQVEESVPDDEPEIITIDE